MNWFEKTTLETNNIRLIPLEFKHSDDLILAATDGNLWDLWFTTIPNKTTITQYIKKAIDDFDNSKGLAFVVVDKKTNTIIGTTRFANATPEHKRLEIGYTWYAKRYQKTYVNSE